MTLRNTPDSFGLVSRILHWTMALMILILLPLGLRLAGMQPSLSTLWLYGLHKTLGLTALALVLVRIIWHRISPPPAPIGPPRAWETRAAKAGHVALYVLMLAMPLSGWIASSATGIDVMFAERWVVPPIAPVSETIDQVGFAIHGILGKLLLALVVLHMAAAVKREMEGDGTLRRMIRGRA
jgi:cytochrome b561